MAWSKHSVVRLASGGDRLMFAVPGRCATPAATTELYEVQLPPAQIDAESVGRDVAKDDCVDR
jgi:hypothetical protein